MKCLICQLLRREQPNESEVVIGMLACREHVGHAVNAQIFAATESQPREEDN